MKTYFAKIRITLRKGILDVQGKTVENALHSLSYDNMNNIRIGKYVELSINAENLDQAHNQVNDACKNLIANPIIEDYTFEIDEKIGQEA
jgi:phosphoribosylformylglycinamidine synthase